MQSVSGKQQKKKPGPAAATDPGTQSLLVKIGSKKKSQQQIRKEARQQEERYVQFRKEEILANTHLTHRGKLGVSYEKTRSLRNVQLQDTEVKFPAPKMGAGMDFGVYKARLLTKKPNPKYAVWTDKKIKEGHYIGLDIAEYIKSFKATEKNGKNRPTVDPKKDMKGEKHGNYEDAPLDEDGDPLWTAESDEDTSASEDDLLINFETIEEAVLNPKKLEFPRSEQKCSWDDDFKELKRQNKVMDKEEIVRNTLRSVINLNMSAVTGGKAKEQEPVERCTWAEWIVASRYNREDVPCNIQPKQEKNKLRNIVKEVPKPKKKTGEKGAEKK